MYRDLIQKIFEREYIDLWGVLPEEECVMQKPEIFHRTASFSLKSSIIFAIPYYGGRPKNFSAYAAAKDYHFYISEVAKRICNSLRRAIPEGSFAAFADHSPIDERLAAVKSGIGIFGENGLVLTEKYSSFIFLGDILTDIPANLLGWEKTFPIASCEGCGACKKACPTGILRGEGEDCLSAITQKKGELTASEQELMRKCNTAWGCDICQEACPWTHRALEKGTIYSQIPYFCEDRIEELTSAAVGEMGEEEFRLRAFAWRGRKTVLRNTLILESEGKKRDV